MSTTPVRRSSPTLGQAVAVNGGAVGVMWLLEVIDQMTLNSLDPFGITPRDPSELLAIFTAPWLHFGWGHLVSNSIPFIVLGVLIYLSGATRWLVTFIVTAIVSGITVWLISPPFTNTAGASGVVFGFLTYLLVRGFFTRRIGQILIAVFVMMIYGGVLWGVLPVSSGVSWQGHLGGAIGGVLAAWLMHNRGERKAQYGV